MAKVKSATESKDWISQRSFQQDDGSGRAINVCVWDQPGEDVLGMVVRSRKVAETMAEVGARGRWNGEGAQDKAFHGGRPFNSMMVAAMLLMCIWDLQGMMCSWNFLMY